MTESAPDPSASTEKDSSYTPPEGVELSRKLSLPGREVLDYTATAGWTVLRDKEKPAAEMFSVSYVAAKGDPATRPLTFVFNGGPGAASAYLHVGALGPDRVVFEENGVALPPPAQLVENEDSWLAFTDLVFIDPVGTGFSRIIEDEKKGEKKEGGEKKDEKRYFGVERDLKSLGEFIRRWLASNDRWLSPIFIAGESYGGFRSAKLVKLLQQDFGIGLSGAVVISPVLEFGVLGSTDYDVLSWIDRFPSMALAAAHHEQRSVSRTEAEEFAADDLVRLLAKGRGASTEDRAASYSRIAALLGLDEDYIRRQEGRIGMRGFARELLRRQGKVCGLYDASVTIDDPFPDRDSFEGPDPTLHGIDRIFAAGINTLLRGRLGIETEREYHLLSMEVNEAWKVDFKRHGLECNLGATDDLRYGMSINPHMKVRITHGVYDLVTPYFASERICRQMKLSESLAKNLSLKHYRGGHMFYAWEESRREFRRDMEEFYRDCAAGSPAE
jgi:carboxypeptidase C (cathepsin A)